jgi:predicted TIM-barrel fold metal-dependent hydrolase
VASSVTGVSASQQIRETLDHPVIDADGHVLEFMPAALPFLREALGPKLFEQYRSQTSPIGRIMGGASLPEREQTRAPQSAWWGNPAAKTIDLATATIPALLHERLPELGIDFCVLYPTKTLGTAGVEDQDMRIGLCRGLNAFFAETYLPFADRMTVAGVVPMVTPDEAVAELAHCRELGLKVVGLPEGVTRPIPRPDPSSSSPFLLPGQAHWFDTFGLDSAHDYDPVWQALGEGGFAAVFHGGIGHIAPYTFTSITSYVFNHIGFFAERMQRLCKSLFFGGVTRRFPDLNIAFLECGVGWASSLLVDIVEHWEKRNLDALHENLDPQLVDLELFEQLMRKYGGALLDGVEQLRESLQSIPAVGVPPAELDEFRHLGVTSKSELRDLFVPRFYFGCEADDRTLSFAFSRANAFGARLQPVFSSDIAHWDVEDMAAVVAEAWGLVRKELLTPEDFRDLTFTNPARLFTGANPDFFEGTAVAEAVRGLKPVAQGTS